MVTCGKCWPGAAARGSATERPSSIFVTLSAENDTLPAPAPPLALPIVVGFDAPTLKLRIGVGLSALSPSTFMRRSRSA